MAGAWPAHFRASEQRKFSVALPENPTNKKVSRRTLLRSAVATAVLGGANGLLPHPLYAAVPKPETTKAILGFIALTDAAPLIIAKEKGFFAKYGMADVEV